MLALNSSREAFQAVSITRLLKIDCRPAATRCFYLSVHFLCHLTPQKQAERSADQPRRIDRRESCQLDGQVLPLLSCMPGLAQG
jgi:hypothetical protein